MMSPEAGQPLDEERRAFIVSMLQKIPESVSQPLLADPSIRADLALPIEESLRVVGQRFARSALIGALKDVADGKPVTLSSVNGAATITESWLEEDGTAILAIDTDGARFANVGLLSADQATRSRTLEVLLTVEDLSHGEEARLRALIDAGPISEQAFIDLEALVETTPKAVYRNLQREAAEGLSFELLVPEELQFFQALLGVAPPETLGGYRDAWVSHIASLDRVRRARCIALNAPLAVLKGDLVAPAARELDREVRLRLARFLAEAPDPLSQLAGFQLAAAELSDPEFKAIGDEVLPRLLDADHERTKPALSFLTSAIILTSTVAARRRTLLDWPIYARRLASYLHASLLVRTFGTGQIDVEAMQQLVAPFRQNHRLVELCDARTTPFGLWAAPSAEGIHAVVVSRVARALGEIDETARPAEWSAAIETVVEKITSGPDALAYLAPGPFDPFEDDWAGLIELPKDEVEQAIDNMKAGTEPQRTLSLLLNLVVAFDVPPEQLQAFTACLPAFLKSLPDENFTTGTDLALQLAARWKLPPLAETLIDQSLPRVATEAIRDLSAGPRFSLLGSACNIDLETWGRKAGEYMNGFAYALRPGLPIRNMITAVELICEYAPALAPPLSSAKSFAMLAYDNVPPNNSGSPVEPQQALGQLAQTAQGGQQ